MLLQQRGNLVFTLWPECQEQVLGYPKAQFAAFETMEKAIEYHDKHINEEYAQKFTNSHIHQLSASTMTCADQLNQITEQHILQPIMIPSSSQNLSQSSITECNGHGLLLCAWTVYNLFTCPRA
jgi:viroplasmin and RNaseH domain-containing protein